MIVLSAFLFSCGNSEKKSNESTSSDEVSACCKNKGNEATSSDNVPECCKNKGMEMLFPSEVSAKGDSYLGKEVAEKAGVSVATVSRVLNNNPAVSEKTAKIVRETIEELDVIKFEK